MADVPAVVDVVALFPSDHLTRFLVVYVLVGAVQVYDLAAVEREGERRIPRYDLVLYGGGVERELEAVVVELAEVVVYAAEARDRGDRARYEQVLGLGDVELGRAAQHVVEESEVETEVPRFGSLPREVCVGELVDPDLRGSEYGTRGRVDIWVQR